ncbi:MULTISPECIES: TetR/AcrR family transcriptional regulator [Mycolicibacterium]|uniref:TetR family transcriptional regulator n=3 Tax=Mycolicibacterium TaxID=1866885 RepID=A0A378W926_9MYCO|nr:MULTISPECIES: TetR/AcrR family transcriptional regulator [Mycolicibacterium]KLI08978.1 TetR family transcriptional regulator [Mycolicibacterium senegalense]KLO52947.1 TetR family transcriptional regulator [Mycolicibacterium senegalense]MCV7337630.1 TetR/AcrR family transcriptional regulator [Mycolicibacterium senegalense]MDR7287326.1 AcrR family transcriptional regulator [Mycolicibacterium senegalense]OBJ99820.1 TetR family transcriptional regulator [Mycolicibacterium conceptionense]
MDTTRERLVEAAVQLFTRHGFAGTSLQMIADELGFTKAAIYYHFRTREQLLTAVLDPVLQQMQQIVEEAENLRGVHSRADHMVRGYVELAVRNRALVSVLGCDPSVNEALRTRPEWDTVIDRQMALLADVDPGPAGTVKAAMVFSGVAGGAGVASTGLTDDELFHHLAEAARRTLGLRIRR